MEYQRILSVQDISCVGQCSLTVAMPILCTCGLETCVLPTAVLSTHTAGFGKPHIRDLTADMPSFAEHWKKNGIRFDGICTGYLGSKEQIAMVSDISKDLLCESGKFAVDPAMADSGKLYSGFDESFVDVMRQLCLQADVILPNLTEAQLLSNLSEENPEFLLEKLDQMGMHRVILTGVAREETMDVLISDDGYLSRYTHEKIPQSYHGTGDMFAAAFFGAWMQGKSLQTASRIAADFTAKCIRMTFAFSKLGYGVQFAPALPKLRKMLDEL